LCFSILQGYACSNKYKEAILVCDLRDQETAVNSQFAQSLWSWGPSGSKEG